MWRQQENNPSRFERRHRNGQSRLFERSVSGRRQRNDPSGFEDVESSSAAQRRVLLFLKIDIHFLLQNRQNQLKKKINMIQLNNAEDRLAKKK